MSVGVSVGVAVVGVSVGVAVVVEVGRRRWSKQLASSEATRCVPTEKCADLSAPRPGDGAKVLLRDASPFGTSVTKSWRCECCGELTSIMVRIPKYQVVRPAGGGRPHAEFLVVARLGAVTFGLWRRYSHFEKLNEKIATSFRKEDYQNTHWSWRCLRRRQRWFRCLDREYLALKRGRGADVFL